MTHIFLLKTHNEKLHICDSNSTPHNCLNLWPFLISKPNFLKLIVSRVDYGYFSEETNLHGVFQEKKNPENAQRISFAIVIKSLQIT